eukprot:2605607-Amphidinium_carterae.1
MLKAAALPAGFWVNDFGNHFYPTIEVVLDAEGMLLTTESCSPGGLTAVSSSMMDTVDQSFQVAQASHGP